MLNMKTEKSDKKFVRRKQLREIFRQTNNLVNQIWLKRRLAWR